MGYLRNDQKLFFFTTSTLTDTTVTFTEKKSIYVKGRNWVIMGRRYIWNRKDEILHGLSPRVKWVARLNIKRHDLSQSMKIQEGPRAPHPVVPLSMTNLSAGVFGQTYSSYVSRFIERCGKSTWRSQRLETRDMAFFRYFA